MKFVKLALFILFGVAGLGFALALLCEVCDILITFIHICHTRPHVHRTRRRIRKRIWHSRGNAVVQPPQPPQPPKPPQPQSVSAKTWDYYAPTPNSTEDNLYKFKFVKTDIHWRAYIIRTPDYRSRDRSAASTHYNTDALGKKYVCINGGDPTSESVLQEKAMLWADRTQRYIRTGKAMNDP